MAILAGVNGVLALFWLAMFIWLWRYIPNEKIKCCSHNRCPYRPSPRGKYRTRPWVCPDCNRMWRTRPKQGWDYTTHEWELMNFEYHELRKLEREC